MATDPDQDIVDAIIKPSPELVDLLRDLVRDTYGMRRADGSKITFTVSRGANIYNYFQSKSGTMFCWTTHPCDRGKYYAFNYIPLGKGARTGKAERYKLVNLSTFPRRKQAKASALARWTKERSRGQGHHRQTTEGDTPDGDRVPAAGA